MTEENGGLEINGEARIPFEKNIRLGGGDHNLPPPNIECEPGVSGHSGYMPVIEKKSFWRRLMFWNR
jgi:hypothetical protein